MPQTATLLRDRAPDRLIVAAEPRATSVFANGYRPRRRARLVLGGVAAGALLAAAWSADIVGRTAGDNLAGALLGQIAAIGAVAPMLGRAGGRGVRPSHALRPLGWLSAGALAVSAAYGAIAALGGGLAPRGIQSAAGLGMCYVGLAALGVVPDPFTRLAVLFPQAPTVFLGALTGAFLVGRPAALFDGLLRDAAHSGSPLYGVTAFSLHAIAVVAVTAVVFAPLSYTTGGRARRWLTANPRRITAATAAALIVAGAFTVLYGDVRPLLSTS